MSLHRWLQRYQKHLLPVIRLDKEKPIIRGDSSIFAQSQQRNSIEGPFSDCFSDYLEYATQIEEEFATSQAKLHSMLKQQQNPLPHHTNKQMNKYPTHSPFTSWNSKHIDCERDLEYERKPFEFQQNFTTRFMHSCDGKEYFIIGTYHSLQESSVEVMNAFEAFNPDSLVLELCGDRVFQLTDANISERTLPGRVYDDLRKNPHDLTFLMKSSEFQVAFESARRSQQGCVLLPGDLNLYYVQNRRKYLRAQCTCNVRQIRDKNSPMKQVLSYVFFGVVPYMVKRIMQIRINVHAQIEKMETFLKSDSRHCVTNVLNYEREENLVRTICDMSVGSRVFAVVGFGHLDSVYEMMQKRERVLIESAKTSSTTASYLNDVENENYQSESFESLLQRNQSYEQTESAVAKALKSYQHQKYCANLD